MNSCLPLATSQGPNHDSAFLVESSGSRKGTGRKRDDDFRRTDQSSSELSGCHALEFLFLVLQNLPENRSGVDAWSFESNRTVEEKQPRFLWKSPWHRGLRLKQPFKTVTIFVQERGMIC